MTNPTPADRAFKLLDGVDLTTVDRAWLAQAIATEIQAESNAQLMRQRSEPINALVALCHGRSTAAGWWDGVDIEDPNIAGAKLALIHSEISEALEGMRKGLMDDHLPHRSMFEVELADAVIRICDLAGAKCFDLGGAITEKLEYNARRKDHTREARAAAGGKKI